MISLLAALFAVTALSDLDDGGAVALTREQVAAEIAFATNSPAASSEAKTVKITSRRADYDRRGGVIMFDGSVYAEDPEFCMHGDRMYVFVDALNQLKRLVVMGHVAITNGLKSGQCDSATYVRELKRIIMLGKPGRDALLVDDDKRRSTVSGTRITFWIDSEQVEVERSAVTLDGGLPSGGLGAAFGAAPAAGAPTNATPASVTQAESKAKE